MRATNNEKNPLLEQTSLFTAGGSMGELMRNHNWASHPLGKPELWPKSLQTGIRMMLLSGFPMFIWWSKELYMFHNDAFMRTFVGGHEQALGAKAREVWADIWGQLGEIVEEILAKNTTFYAQEMLVTPQRKGFQEETYWSFSYSPMPDDEGKVNGIFCTCNDVTANVLAQRRLLTIHEVSKVVLPSQTVEQVCQSTLAILEQKPHDTPFAAIYLTDQHNKLGQLMGKTSTAIPLPQKVELPFLPTHTLLDRAAPVDENAIIGSIQDQLALSSGSTLSFASLTTPPLAPAALRNKALVLPLINVEQKSMPGFFVLQISPMLEYDEAYRRFHQLLLAQFISALEAINAKQIQQRQSQALQTQLLSLFEQTPVAVTYLQGKEYVIELANPLVLEIWGRPKEEVLHKPLFEAMPEIRNQGLEELLSGVWSSGQAHVGVELPIALNRYGKRETVYFTFIYHPLRDTQGMITGIMVVASDVTQGVLARQTIEENAHHLYLLNEELEQKVMNRTKQLQEANAGLRLANEQLFRTNQDLDNFVYTASHDLKAPILNIEGLLKALERKLGGAIHEDKQVIKLFEMLNASVGRFKNTIADLTQVARINKEDPEDIALISVSEVLGEVWLDLASQIEEIKASLDVVLSCEEIHFSRKNLKSILYNLISNALKYHSKERMPKVQIRCQTQGEYHLLTIADNGLGMDMNQEEKIFGLFKRLHSHVEGTGIGLYIVKQIIENAGGKIEVESQVGVGSAFKVYLKRSEQNIG